MTDTIDNQELVATRSGCGAGWIYRSLGVEPVINCAGVRTNYGGSNPRAEVRMAMDAAADAFVDLDELAERVGHRLASLTGAEWGIVTAGSAAGLTLATAACLVGNDPELMSRLPRTDGIPNGVAIPSDQRFTYDHAIRMTGAEVVTFSSEEELGASLDSGQVAMICVLGRSDARSRIPLPHVVAIARERGIPILVAAAGLSPACPDPWLSMGASLVIYSGGKYLFGPQSTGILLGDKRLCRAAWYNGPPHQAFGRPLKIGKEEIVGALVALECWLRDDNEARHAQWRAQLVLVDDIVRNIPGVTTELLVSSGSVTADRLRIIWAGDRIPISAERLRKTLLQGQPRVLLHDFWATSHSIVVDPVNLTDEEAVIAGNAIAFALRHAKAPEEGARNELLADVSGTWRIAVEFLQGSAVHSLELTQDGSRLTGVHQARRSTGAVSGLVRGSTVRLISQHRQSPMSLFYEFRGNLSGDRMSGELHLGAAAPEHLGPVFRRQFGDARWSASRSQRAPEEVGPQRTRSSQWTTS
jgi:seryl-tRNA(Sec) selenium transferase